MYFTSLNFLKNKGHLPKKIWNFFSTNVKEKVLKLIGKWNKKLGVRVCTVCGHEARDWFIRVRPHKIPRRTVWPPHPLNCDTRISWSEVIDALMSSFILFMVINCSLQQCEFYKYAIYQTKEDSNKLSSYRITNNVFTETKIGCLVI